MIVCDGCRATEVHFQLYRVGVRLGRIDEPEFGRERYADSASEHHTAKRLDLCIECEKKLNDKLQQFLMYFTNSHML